MISKMEDISTKKVQKQKSQEKTVKASAVMDNGVAVHENSRILHIIYGSRTGNSKSAAILAHEYAEFKGIRSVLIDMQEFVPQNFRNLKNILVAVSTHGEGDPPLAAENLLASLSDTDAPWMDHARFSILALGDSSYRHYCKTGRDFRERLIGLGATEVFGLKECDIDFEEDAKQWVEGAVNAFAELLPLNTKAKNRQFTFSLIRPDEGIGNLYMAKVIDKKILNPGNPVKKIIGMTLSLKNSGMKYQPGDTIGIYSVNSRRVVDELIRLQGFDPTHVIERKDKKELLKQVLIADYELTLLTPMVMKRYAALSKHPELNALLEDKAQLQEYCDTRDVFDMIGDFPSRLTVAEFISVLRKLPPRLYSVASSPLRYPDEVRLLVGVVAYSQNERTYEGVCSSFISTRIEKGDSIGIHLEENEKFRLPGDNVPVIMISAGTGLAPFLAFLQEREAKKASGKNWLFFGEQFQSYDFLYRDELESYLANGLLTRLDTAFSRDQDEKVYVGQRMAENRHEFFRWINHGAVVYLSGNKRKLAVSVRQALLQIIMAEGNLSPEDASAYLEKMKTEKRYLEDVY